MACSPVPQPNAPPLASRESHVRLHMVRILCSNFQCPYQAIVESLICGWTVIPGSTLVSSGNCTYVLYQPWQKDIRLL